MASPIPRFPPVTRTDRLTAVAPPRLLTIRRAYPVAGVGLGCVSWIKASTDASGRRPDRSRVRRPAAARARRRRARRRRPARRAARGLPRRTDPRQRIGCPTARLETCRHRRPRAGRPGRRGRHVGVRRGRGSHRRGRRARREPRRSTSPGWPRRSQRSGSSWPTSRCTATWPGSRPTTSIRSTSASPTRWRCCGVEPGAAGARRRRPRGRSLHAVKECKYYADGATTARSSGSGCTRSSPRSRGPRDGRFETMRTLAPPAGRG